MTWKVLNYCLQKLHRRMNEKGTMHNIKLHRANYRRRLNWKFSPPHENFPLLVDPPGRFSPEAKVSETNTATGNILRHSTWLYACHVEILFLDVDSSQKYSKGTFGVIHAGKGLALFAVGMNHEWGNFKLNFYEGLSEFRYPNILER